jgi:hypothetical protein
VITGVKSRSTSNGSFEYRSEFVTILPMSVSISTYPSGAARAVSSAPILPLAPVRLSVMICWPQLAVSLAPISRVRMSEVPPAG